MATLAETLAVLAAKKSEDETDWGAVIAIEEATGHLSFLNSRKQASQKFYDIAIEQLNKDPPDILGATSVLAGAQAIDQQRGTGSAATAALAAVVAFAETPPDLAGTITEAPDTAAGAGTVV